MELQMAFGQTKRDEFSGPDFQNSIMAFLATAGGAYPVGTTFPNHAVMGVTVADFNEGGTQGLKVTAIPPDSAAAKAGMQIGDVVTRIANKRLRSFADYLSATAKAAESPTYPVDIIRNGNAMTLTFDRAFRPAITQQIAPHSPEAASQVPGAPRSVADELTKLAKLRSDGVLTDAEFQAQKMKLLGQ
jgi:membrane-associated protease RseP (regulator of RpoE activity)